MVSPHPRWWGATLAARADHAADAGATRGTVDDTARREAARAGAGPAAQASGSRRHYPDAKGREEGDEDNGEAEGQEGGEKDREEGGEAQDGEEESDQATSCEEEKAGPAQDDREAQDQAHKEARHQEGGQAQTTLAPVPMSPRAWRTLRTRMARGRRVRHLRSGVVLTALLTGTCGREPAPPDPTPAVRDLLTRSAEAWNRDDLDAFLVHYADDTSTTFVAGGRVHHGFEWIRTNYAPGFDADTPRDSLRFEAVEAKALGDDFVLATARYVLHRAGAVTSAGPFTIVLQQRQGQWKIIHDHTSRDP